MHGSPPPAAEEARPEGGGPLSVVLVSNLYPPHHLGGYELRCRDVCRELVRRGHRVTVLTSREGRRGVEHDEGVRVVRELHRWPDGVANGPRSVVSFTFATGSDCRRLRRELRRARADVLAFWNQGGLTSALLAVTPRRGCGILCDVSSDWLLDVARTGGNWFRVWERPARSGARRLGQALLRAFAALVLRAPPRRPAFPPGRAYFASAERKAHHVAEGVAVEDAALIRSGINLDVFRPRGERTPRDTVQALFLGRIKRRKGLHTTVLALAYLPERVRLRVVGTVEEPEYLHEVGELVRATQVGARIEIADAVPHDEVPALLADADLLVFASEQPEAFSRLVLEAFACGTPVVGTTLGGTAEVLHEGQTGLTFQPGNARELADQIRRLVEEPGLRERIVANARELVTTRYALGWTVDQIEALLRQAHERANPAPEGA